MTPRLPPALAARATPAVVERLPPPPARVLELDFAGIHAPVLELEGYHVVVVERDEAHRARAAERAGEVLAKPPPERFDAVVAPAGADLGGVDAGLVVVVRGDGSVVTTR